MPNDSYNMSKSALRSFLERRLNDTFGRKISLAFSNVAGNDANPRMSITADNASLHAHRTDGSIPKESPVPVAISIVVNTDGNGDGNIVVSFLRERLGGSKSYDNTNSNLRKWGWTSLPENSEVPKVVYTSRISNYNVEPAMLKTLRTIRSLFNGIASYR